MRWRVGDIVRVVEATEPPVGGRRYYPEPALIGRVGHIVDLLVDGRYYPIVEFPTPGGPTRHARWRVTPSCLEPATRDDLDLQACLDRLT